MTGDLLALAPALGNQVVARILRHAIHSDLVLSDQERQHIHAALRAVAGRPSFDEGPPLSEVLRIWVPGTPVPQGTQKVAPSGPQLRGDDLARAVGVFVLGKNHATGWRGRQVWSNEGSLMAWRAAIAAVAKDAWGGREPLDGEVWISTVFVFPWLQRHRQRGRPLTSTLRASNPQYKNTSPDLDKLNRAVHDALEQDARILTNDARIVGYYGRPHKRYGDHPGAEIRIALSQEKS